MGRLLNKVNEKLNKNKQIKKEEEFNFVYDLLMAEYGWIPLEEYCKLPQQTINLLVERIHDRRKKEQGKNKLPRM